MTKRLWTILVLLCCFVTLLADEVKVTMKNGTTITGELKELVATDYILLTIAGVDSKISMSEVASVERASAIISSTRNDKDLVYGEYSITDTKEYPDSFSIRIGDQEITMILVRGGWFNMGYDDRHSWSYNSEPVHHVILSSFYVSKQLLNRRAADILQQKKKPSNSTKPFGTYSRKTVETIVSKLVAQTELPYQLITEAEWEYVSLMPFAEQIFSTKGAIEWCFDYYDEYPEKEQINPQGPDRGNTYVVRSYTDDNKKWKRQKRASSYSTTYGGSEANIRLAISADQVKDL